MTIVRASTGIGLRTAALLSAIVWAAHLSVIVTSSMSVNPSWNPLQQLARLLVAAAGFLLMLGIHFASPVPRGAHFGRGFLRTIALCAPAALLLTFYSHYQFEWLAPSNPPKGLWRDVAFNLAYYQWIFAAWAALYVGLHTMREVQDQARRVAEIEVREHEARLLALRYQLNPHFFFNALNTLSGLIGAKRPAEAERVIICMADFLRYSLNGEPMDLVRLGSEVSAQHDYLEIEKVRFGSRLKVELDIAANCLWAAVPALILQPLVENAIKHGVGNSEETIRIAIGARRNGDRLECWVENQPTGTGGERPAGFGLGLRNVEQRLVGIFGGGARLSSGPTAEGGWRSSIICPFVEAEK